MTTIDVPGSTGTDLFGINDGGVVTGYYVGLAGQHGCGSRRSASNVPRTHAP